MREQKRNVPVGCDGSEDFTARENLRTAGIRDGRGGRYLLHSLSAGVEDNEYRDDYRQGS